MKGDPSRLADFKKRDANHDGVVTKEEAIAYGRERGIANKIMREADKNHDGFLDRGRSAGLLREPGRSPR